MFGTALFILGNILGVIETLLILELLSRAYDMGKSDAK